MFAIDLVLDPETTERSHPQGLARARTDICVILRGFGFERQPSGMYLCDNDGLANLLIAMNALKALLWFPASMRAFRAFRVEQWSDFTSFIKS